MKNAILAWYAYSESGAVTQAARSRPQALGLADPDRVAELFADARALDHEMTPQGWKYLWAHYGLYRLIDLARRGPWPASARDEEVADALVSESVSAGYDPVSGQFGDFCAQTQTFEPTDG